LGSPAGTKVSRVVAIIKVLALIDIHRECDMSDDQVASLRGADFPYFGAVTVPKAGLEELKTVSLWLVWVFLFDDGRCCLCNLRWC